MTSLGWSNVLRSIVVFMTLLGTATNSFAQGAPTNNLPPPPLHTFVDSHRIDMISGTPTIGGMSVSIGTGDSGIARLAGTQRDMVDNHTGTLTNVTIYTQSNDAPAVSGVAAGSYLMVNILGEEELFLDSSGIYTNYKNTGGTLVCGSTTCTYVNRRGASIIFDKNRRTNYKTFFPCGCTTTVSDQNTIPPGSKSRHENAGLVSSITYPTGEVLTYTYVTGAGFERDVISAVSSSLGWMLKYYFSGISSDLDSNQYSDLHKQNRSVIALNSAIEYCDPSARECSSLQQTWPKSSMLVSVSTGWPSQPSPGITYNSRSVGTEVTNALGYTDNFHKVEPISPANTLDIYTSFGGIFTTFDKVGPTYLNGAYVQTSVSRRLVTLRIGNQFNFSYSYSSGPDGIYVYDQYKHFPTSFTDRLNRIYTYTYEDQWGRYIDKIISPDATPNVTSPTGGYIDYDYDLRGNVTFIKEYPKNGGTPLVTSATYPTTCSNIKTCNNPETITHQNGVTTTYTYDPDHGGLLTETKPAVGGVQAQVRYGYEQKTPYVKNSSGGLDASTPVWRLVSISKCRTTTLDTCVGTADEQRTEFSDFTDNLLSKTTIVKSGDGSNILTTTRDYDIYGNVSWEDGPRPGDYDTTYYFYDAMRQVVGMIGTDPDGSGAKPRQATRTRYNGDGKILSVEKGLVFGTTFSDVESMSVQIKSIIDYSSVHGLPIVERLYAADILEKVTQKSYDNELRLECVARRLNRAAFNSLPSSACTLGATGNEGSDRITKYTYDLAGALVMTTSAYGTALQRNDRVNQYSPVNGLLTAEVDGNGNNTFYKYDDYNRPWKTVYPQPGNGAAESATDYTQTNYRPGSSLVDSVRLRDGQLHRFIYDALGRVQTKYGTINESMGYDNFDQIVYRSNVSTGGPYRLQSTYTYNALGWLLGETLGGSVYISGHGVAPTGTTSYGYDAYGRRNRLTWPDNFYVTYDYDTNGYPGDYLQKIKQSDGTLLASFAYDDFGRRESLTRGNGVTTDYEYDDLSRLETMSTDVGGSATADDISESFTYTTSGQLKSCSTTALNANYFHTPTAVGATNYVPDALNRIASSNGTAFVYDSRGNLTTDNTGTNYTYNTNNLLLRSTKSDVNTDLSYDGANRLFSIRSSDTTTRFVYDGSDLIAETDFNNNVLRRYVHGPQTDDPIVWLEGSGTSTKRYYNTDRQGSIVGVTDQSGLSYAINAYDEYGVQKSGNVGRFQYTGQLWLHEVGLYYYKTRLYSPSLGRFLQTDPVGYDDQMNLYAYVRNDPVNAVDPSGMYTCEVDRTSKTCEGTKDEIDEMKKEMKGYRITDATSGFGQMSNYNNRAAGSEPNDKNNFDGQLAMSKGGKRNIGVGDFNRNSDPKAVEEAMKAAKNADKKEHYEALRGLLKVIKRGGVGVGPVIPMTPEMMEMLLPHDGTRLPEFDISTEEGLSACVAAGRCA